MNLRFNIVISIIIITSTSACYYDKADQLYPDRLICDPAAPVSYNGILVPIFKQQCYSCHAGINPVGGSALKMGSYAADKVLALQPKFYGSIAHIAGFRVMPEGAPKLSDCQISSIKKWIDAGAPNN